MKVVYPYGRESNVRAKPTVPPVDFTDWVRATFYLNPDERREAETDAYRYLMCQGPEA